MSGVIQEMMVQLLSCSCIFFLVQVLSPAGRQPPRICFIRRGAAEFSRTSFLLLSMNSALVNNWIYSNILPKMFLAPTFFFAVRGRPKKKIWPKVRNVWLGRDPPLPLVKSDTLLKNIFIAFLNSTAFVCYLEINLFFPTQKSEEKLRKFSGA